jgi:hypothetical protein
MPSIELALVDNPIHGRPDDAGSWAVRDFFAKVLGPDIPPGEYVMVDVLRHPHKERVIVNFQPSCFLPDLALLVETASKLAGLNTYSWSGRTMMWCVPHQEQSAHVAQ